MPRHAVAGHRLLTALVLGAGLLSCDDPLPSPPSPVTPDPDTGRWYSEAQVEQGRQVFLDHCAACHGESAQGLAADWKARLPDGSFPPPPLDGSAHAWHHPLSVLLQTIDEGGVPLGGTMPAFGAVLKREEKLAAIAFFQQFWDDQTYFNWQAMGGTQ
ncbi:MAG: hypothetical protein RLZZ385_602 [Pseudomonadota bacterium]|jgi:mono/diheme cytochrome c family protein